MDVKPDRVGERWGLYVVVVLCLTLAAGYGTAFGYFRLPEDERRLFDAYSAFMTTAQQSAYLSQPTHETRRAYAESVGLPQRLAALPEGSPRPSPSSGSSEAPSR